MNDRQRLDWLLAAYEANVLNVNTEDSLYDEALSLLIRRDSIEELMAKIGTEKARQKVDKLDRVLKSKRDLFVTMGLITMRASVPKPSRSRWWWYLDQMTEEQRITA